MKKCAKDEHGFTLIEMMIVLTIISVLLLILVPNLTKNSSVANDKSCEATIKMVQGQIGVYMSEHNGKPPESMDDLKDYIENYDEKNGVRCPDNTELTIDNGKVVKGKG